MLDGIVTVWDLDGKRMIRHFGDKHFLSGIYSLVLLPDGKTLAINNSPREKVGLWDVVAGKKQAFLMAELAWQDSPINSMAFSSDGTIIAGTTFFGAHLLFWDAHSGRLLKTIHFPQAFAITFSPDRNTLISSHADGTVKLWDTRKPISR